LYWFLGGGWPHAAILYAPHGTTAALLRSGVPLALMPENLEQGLIAWRVQALGAGFMVGPHGRYAQPAAALRALLVSPACKAAAMAFARRHAEARPDHVAALMAARALDLALDAAARGAGSDRGTG
jgi:UDP:flavonoid glycosyltransferase YjiC (YdhE family)